MRLHAGQLTFDDGYQAMRMPPYYPEPPNVPPINWKRWGQGILIIISIFLLITNIFWPKNTPNKTTLFWFTGFILPVLVYLLIFSIYYFIYQIRIYHKNVYFAVTEKDENEWWGYQSKYLPIIDTIIIGSLGRNQMDWAMLIRNKTVPPFPKINDKTEVLCNPLLISNKENKDKMLAKLLFNELDTKYPVSNLNIKHIYWLGSESALNVFSNLVDQQYNTSPISKGFIHSIKDIDDIIDNHYEHHHNDEKLIIAGTNLNDDPKRVVQSESGFLWLIGNTGNYAIHRCEAIDCDNERVSDLTSQLKRYAGLPSAPALTISMDHKSAEAFTSSDWNSVDNNLSPYYGDVSLTSPFLAISQGVLHCIQNSIDSCGWTSNIIDNKHFAGVISRHEEK
ncbi:hypothetical protein HBA43_06735 [Providencia rettgeri]|uniref:hypothetical protein n=2 Tax=Providencia TaxID=586 RepID=UPI001419CC66|nr:MULTISPECIES: hypothetical protein [Providencia]EIU7558597.1 hypothetical protein [Providencia rettgeri]EJD6042817.1 hypothetical protein [Providencia rettgeri]EJD6371911.1 hypothetical protein [Providencia rettgeri]ELR5029633.1 hypothetical protein [Providencia rettgeri]ELR5108639.1 hypothetical protein [Providencia rettgeri]